MSKNKKIILVCFALLLALFVSCNDAIPDSGTKNFVEVKFNNFVDDAIGNIPEDAIYDQGAVITIPQELSHSSYKFSGWYLTPDGSSEKLEPGSKLKLSDTNVELYAIWNLIFSDTCRVSSPSEPYNFSYDSSFVFNPNTFFYADNTKFNSEICLLSSLLACDVYSNAKVELENKEESKTFDNETSIYAAMGFAPVSDITCLKSSDYSTDKDDITNFVVSHKNYGKKSLVFVSIQGTNGTLTQWKSNCDMGDDSTPYYNISGNEHPQWVNKNRHKGFDVAATRVKENVDKYISANCAGQDIVMLITGHSRGAAIANILGATFEKDNSKKTFTYTFAAPKTTDEKEEVTSSFSTVFNIVNSDDLVAAVPPANIGFSRYGYTLLCDVSKSEMANYYKAKTGKNYQSTYLSTWEQYLYEITSTRKEVYEFRELSDPFSTSSLPSASSLLKYLKTDNDAKKVVAYMPNILYQSIPFFMGNSSEVASEKKSCLAILMALLESDSKLNSLAEELIFCVLPGINGIANAHEAQTYVLIAEKDSYNN